MVGLYVVVYSVYVRVAVCAFYSLAGYIFATLCNIRNKYTEIRYSKTFVETKPKNIFITMKDEGFFIMKDEGRLKCLKKREACHDQMSNIIEKIYVGNDIILTTNLLYQTLIYYTLL